MAHVRQLIREAVTTAVTGLVTTGTRVVQSRVYPIAAGSLPGLAVYTLEDELLDGGETLDDRQVRRLSVAIEARVRSAAGDFDDTVDTIDSEVSVAMYGAAFTSGGKQLTRDVTWRSLVVEYDVEDQSMAMATMTWDIIYHIDAAAPSTLPVES